MSPRQDTRVFWVPSLPHNNHNESKMQPQVLSLDNSLRPRCTINPSPFWTWRQAERRASPKAMQCPSSYDLGSSLLAPSSLMNPCATWKVTIMPKPCGISAWREVNAYVSNCLILHLFLFFILSIKPEELDFPMCLGFIMNSLFFLWLMAQLPALDNPRNIDNSCPLNITIYLR